MFIRVHLWLNFKMIDCSPYIQTLNNKPLAVFGLGVSGLASVEALVKSSAHVIAWDDDEERRAQALKLGAEIKPLSQEILSNCAALILAPGVPLYYPEPHDVVKAANETNCEIICDIEILHRLNHGRKTIGITGTNGKSTTTALIHHALNTLQVPNAMGGNIGTAALALDMPEKDGVIVLEISSYQMDLCPTYRPDIAILLNITPDHIDRHGTFEKYEAAKRRIFDRSDQIKIDHPEIDERVRGLANMKGEHNLQNASAALNACEALGLDARAAVAAIATFPGLNHRQYHVRTIGGVEYINDSKATNAEAAAKALSSYENIYWIVGGQAKEGGLNGLEEFAPRIAHAHIIGEAAPDFAKWMDDNNISYSIDVTLDNAVHSAHQKSKDESEAVVLLSPACASWDQFKSFEDRGDQFAALVKGLK